VLARASYCPHEQCERASVEYRVNQPTILKNAGHGEGESTMALIEEYVVHHTEIAGVQVTCTTYKIGGQYHCVVANVEPGVNVARSSGPTRESALISASHKAKQLFTSA
jgi:hypothetical protein